ncbi:SgcJ/EcaC family oxidoreductase [Saccharothrix syringae]|uniref:SgcJ/EcaC family oxidoreductase n=1 Tax=Saccharothrix syringae TaxID=103733 RepID=A0A5Q0GWA1_SACSY|nr:SgcJ/EcaC family oxidoreductase [Saccharothrix syringae]QFZ18347.1 SgcJ/EcaC family oxidoreductase [Saccharothrix syringae]
MDEDLREVLDRWKDAVDAHDPERVAENFTEDAIFQGLRPHGVGREAVADYYRAQPRGLKAEYEVLETRRLADGLVLGYLAVDFSFVDRPTLHVRLGVLVEDGLISHYQVSRLD